MTEPNLTRASSDHDVWQAAQTLIARYGVHAPQYALQCANLAMEIGNFPKAAHWRRVWQAAQSLVRSGDTNPPLTEN